MSNCNVKNGCSVAVSLADALYTTDLIMPANISAIVVLANKPVCLTVM